MQSSPQIQSHRSRRSDWVGFAFFLCLTIANLAMGASLFRRTAAVAVFLVPTFLHDAIISGSFLLRKPLQRQAKGWIPRATAYSATFLFPAFAFVCSHWQHGWMKASAPSLYFAGVLLWIMGSYMVAWSLFRLRRAFSIVPQARTLISSGPYRLARHPVYAGYILQYGGLTLAYLTPALWAFFLVWWGVLMLRISYEESVLSATFAEYEAYKQRVGRFMPRLIPDAPPNVENAGALPSSLQKIGSAGTRSSPESQVPDGLIIRGQRTLV
jgi:protein-S-isoprenylcysteine O-methyltransferase Ste14